MTFYAAIDTNVIVSSMLKFKSIPWYITYLIETNTIIPLFNDEILNEYYDVLTRNNFGFEHKRVEELIQLIKMKGLFVEKEKTIEEFIDKTDIIFFEIVMGARATADAYLVTGNMKHYPVRSYVVTPREMIDIIEKENGPIQIVSK